MPSQKFLHADIRELEAWPGIFGLVPRMPEQIFLNLKADIKQNGIRTPLAVVKPFEKFIVLDGISRLKAAEELGMKTLPVCLVPATGDEDYVILVLVRAADRTWMGAGQKAAIAARLNEKLVALRKNRASWERIRHFKEFMPDLDMEGKTEKIAARLFQISTGYLNLARKLLNQDQKAFHQLLLGNISVSEAKNCLHTLLPDHFDVPRDKALVIAEEKIRLLEERQERIRKHLEVILPFAKRALKGASLESKYRFVLRPVARDVVDAAARTGDKQTAELRELKKQVAGLEAENLLLSVRHDDPQQIALVHALCTIKAVYELASVQEALQIMKTVPVITEDVLNEFYRLLTRTINFADRFIRELNRISVSTPAHLDQAARDELRKYVDGRPEETAFETPVLRDTARQQLVIYTRSARRDAHNYPVTKEKGGQKHAEK